ncbi:MAG: DUF6427 family protein [Mangrovibacterium sp.]
MLLRFLKSNQAYHFVFIPLMIVALWVRSWLHPAIFPFFEGENRMLLYRPVHQLLNGSAMANAVAAMLFAMLLAFMMLRLNTVFAFIRVRTFLPSNIFVLIISGLLLAHTLHPVYFGALFLLLATERIFSAYESQQIHSNAFDAGFLISVGSLFYFSLIFYFPVIWIGLLLIRKSPEWRHFALALTGALVPWLFAFSYYFLTDSLPELATTINQNLVTPNNLLQQGSFNHLIYLGFLILLILPGSFFLIGQIDEKKISTRKYFQIFFVIFLTSVALLLVVPAVSLEILVIMAIPLTFLISNYLIYMRRQFWGNVLLFLFLGLIIYLQFT